MIQGKELRKVSNNHKILTLPVQHIFYILSKFSLFSYFRGERMSESCNLSQSLSQTQTGIFTTGLYS